MSLWYVKGGELDMHRRKDRKGQLRAVVGREDDVGQVRNNHSCSGNWPLESTF